MNQTSAYGREFNRARYVWSKAPWLIALAVGLGTLMPVPRETGSSGSFDAPDAASRYYESRRIPAGFAGDVRALYNRGMQHVERVTHFSSRAGRSLPFGDYEKTAVLDAWDAARTRQHRWTDSRRSLSPGAAAHSLCRRRVRGGIWKSDDNGITWRPLASGLANLAVNSFAIDPGPPDVMFAGTGEGYFREEIRGTGLPLRGGGLFMTEDGGTSWRRVPGTDTPDFHWVNDLELGISDSRVLFAATRTGVWRSTDWGQSWVALLGTHVRGGCLDLAISPTERDDVLFAACGSYEQATVYNGASTWTKASAAMPDSGVMSAIAVAPGAPDRVAAGTTKGDVLSTRQALAADSLTNWPASRPRDGWVTSVAFDSQNPDTVYATYGSFGGSHVYRSRDGGGTWQALDGSGDSVLPDIPVHSIAIDPDDSSRLYLGTDLGVLVSVDGGQRWMVEATGFGPVVTEWLSLIRDSSGRKRLFAFTHGRGVWRVDVR